ncbi:MAG: acetate--CoA ligase family protein [Proteobacteria bacterium]|nr:acetate--CoA ligase family protein [Pseudomonadota bacterium]
MNKFFYPASIVIYGVSDSPGNLASGILDNLERFSYKGNIYLLGGRGGAIRGRAISRNLNEIEETPDLAVFLIPSAGIPERLDECGKRGIRHVVIESGGFSEFDKRKETLEKEILRIARKRDMKIMGPNCLGTVNIENGLTLPFVPFHPEFTRRGSLSLASQSGGILHDILMLLSCENIGINKLISMGNKLMLNESDFLEYLISDPHTESMAFYLEDIRDGRRFCNLAAMTSKPIVVLKANRKPGTAEIAGFHTSALAGDEFLTDAILKQAGVHIAENMQDMVETLKIFMIPPVEGPGLAVIARSGGHAVLSADAVYKHGFRLAELSEDLFRMVEQKKKVDVIRSTNPVDLGDIFDLDFHGNILEKVLQEEGVDAVLFVHSYDFRSDGDATATLLDRINKISRTHAKPVVFCTISEKEQWFFMKDKAEFPVFSEADQALKALAASLAHRQRIKAGSAMGLKTGQRLIADISRTSGRTALMGPEESFSLLQSYTLPVADFALVRNFLDGKEAAVRLGFPLALKTAAPEVLHKTESAGVILGLNSYYALKQAFKNLKSPQYLLQKMAPPGYELIIGSKVDPSFGRVLLLGMGGIFTEALKDVAVSLMPVNEEGAMEMIRELRGATLLKGYRGKPASDLTALAQSMVKISLMLMEHPEIINLDINPLILFEEGAGCVIVDAKIEIGE